MWVNRGSFGNRTLCHPIQSPAHSPCPLALPKGAKPTRKGNPSGRARSPKGGPSGRTPERIAPALKGIAVCGRFAVNRQAASTFFVGYRLPPALAICRFGQTQSRNLQATPSALLRVPLADSCSVPSLHSNRLGAGLRPSPTFFVGYRHEFGIPSYI